MLSKTKYIRGLQCPKMLWLDCYKSEEFDPSLVNDSTLENGNLVGSYARKYFPNCEEITFNSDVSFMVKETKDKLDKYDVLAEASFVYDKNFCSVDLLRKVKDGYEIYEVKSSTSIKDVYIDDASYQYYVLRKNNINVVRVYIMYINEKYVRNGELNLKELFITEDVTNLILTKQDYIKENIDELENVINNTEEPNVNLTINCDKPYKCGYYNYCRKCLSKPNIFNINRLYNTTKYRLYNEGIITFEDIIKRNPKLNYIQREQVEVEYYDKAPIIKRNKIKEFLDTLTYPIYYLDFETFQQPVPLYDGVSPYMQIPFQYSLHYQEEEKGNLYHKEFLAKEGINPMRSLAEQLVEDIPEDVCVLAYNMMFEKTVIRKLANIYPDLSSKLMNIHDNIKDLMIPFQNHDYYQKEQQGSYSIKYVLPALFPNDQELNYRSLDNIHNGSEAMSAYANLHNKQEDEIKEIRKNLLAYCKLDTLAMVKIHQKLKELVNKEEK